MLRPHPLPCAQHASPAPLLPPTRSLYGAPGASRAAAAGGMGMGGGEAPFSSPFGATQGWSCGGGRQG